MAGKADMRHEIKRVAYQLFMENGYANTTIDQIIKVAGCSKGTFYHHFTAKEELLLAWTTTFDKKYTQWYENVPEEMHAVEKLMWLNRIALDTMEFSSDLESISAIYVAQITVRGYSEGRRQYTDILNAILRGGQLRGEIRDDISFVELAKMFVTLQRGVIYQWCLSGGSYSLKEFGMRMMDLFIKSYRK